MLFRVNFSSLLGPSLGGHFTSNYRLLIEQILKIILSYFFGSIMF